MSDLKKIAEASLKDFHDQQCEALLTKIASYPAEERAAVINALELVKQAEASGEIEKQTKLGRLLTAHELAKGAAIAGNEELAKEAMESFNAGRLSGMLLRQKVAAEADAAKKAEPAAAAK